jgi:hypothetical protein
MGDKSPKSTKRQADQKRAKKDATAREKKRAIAAKQVPKRA